MLCELHACLAQTSSNPSELQAANEIHFAAAAAMAAGAADINNLADQTLSTFKASRTMQMNAYKKAVDVVPSEWDFFSQQLINELSASSANAANLALYALTTDYSAKARVQNGVNIFAGDYGGVESGHAATGQADHGDVSAVTSAPAPLMSALPPESNDATYSIVGVIRSYVQTLRSFITGGQDMGVDWDLLRSVDPKTQRSGLGVVSELLRDATKSFIASSSPCSNTLSEVLATVSQVRGRNSCSGSRPGHDTIILKLTKKSRLSKIWSKQSKETFLLFPRRIHHKSGAGKLP